jgi:hypothetical protein
MWQNTYLIKVVPYISGKIWSAHLIFLFFWQCFQIFQYISQSSRLLPPSKWNLRGYHTLQGDNSLKSVERFDHMMFVVIRITLILSFLIYGWLFLAVLKRLPNTFWESIGVILENLKLNFLDVYIGPTYFKIFANLTCINRTPVCSEWTRWSHGGSVLNE